MDSKEFRKKILWRLLASPVTLYPFVGGVTGLLAFGVLGLGGAGLAAVSVIAILGGLGTFFTRVILGQGGSVAQEVTDELKEEAKARHEQEIMSLRQKLVADGDPRTEQLLDDLRNLMEAFDEENTRQTERGSGVSSMDILSGVDRLFKGCLAALENAARLAGTASRISSKEAKTRISDRRDACVRNIEESIGQLGGILAAMQSHAADSVGSDASLRNLRGELDQTLEVARRVEEHMQSLDGATPKYDESEFLNQTE